MNLFETTAAYEHWLGSHVAVIGADLKLKHARMAEGAFPFLRATFYRWVNIWRETCSELFAAPRLLAVGDLHVENFGTWRDAEGRLVWGVNDVDEAAPMPYTIDLVRLATSALLAIDMGHLSMSPETACTTILDGYRKTLLSGGCAFVLEETHEALRAMALSADRDPSKFWAKLSRLRTTAAPPDVRRLLSKHLPEPKLKFRMAHRVAGLGSLGRPRYVALAEWRNALIAREAKSLVPSAFGWAIGQPQESTDCTRIIARAVRCPDPYFAVTDGWIVRRLAPRCSRIELAQLPKRRDELCLLEAMGRETANLHLGSASAVGSVRKHLARLKKGWLPAAAARMAEATYDDWRDWKAKA